MSNDGMVFKMNGRQMGKRKFLCERCGGRTHPCHCDEIDLLNLQYVNDQRKKFGYPPFNPEPQVAMPQFTRPFSIDAKELEVAHAMLTTQVTPPASESIAKTMADLVKLQGRLRLMIQELEDLVKQ